MLVSEYLNSKNVRVKASLDAEDIPTLVENLCCGNGRDGSIEGFVKLNREDCAKIY